MDTPIFLNYSQAELDRNFDQRGWIGVANAEAFIARGAAASAATRGARRHVADVHYGDGPDETLDIFKADRADAPVAIFVHGGAWKNFTKNDFSYVADGFVPAGFHVVILNFTNLPAARLPQMVEQVRKGIAWTYRNARSFGGDAEKLVLVAHSSGAHLSAMALTTDWQAAHRLPAGIVKSAALACGVYDLAPVILSARSSYVRLEDDEETMLSPIWHAARVSCPVFVAHAEGDTDEFKRQSREFAAKLEQAGKLSGLLQVPGVNHFALMDSLGSASSAASQAIAANLSANLQRIEKIQ